MWETSLLFRTELVRRILIDKIKGFTLDILWSLKKILDFSKWGRALDKRPNNQGNGSGLSGWDKRTCHQWPQLILLLTGSRVMKWQSVNNCKEVERSLWMREDHIRRTWEGSGCDICHPIAGHGWVSQSGWLGVSFLPPCSTCIPSEASGCKLGGGGWPYPIEARTFFRRGYTSSWVPY